MALFEFEIGEETYTGETASAKEQFEALHIVSNNRLIIAGEKAMSDKATTLMVMNMELSELRKLESLLVKGKITRQRDEVPVAVNLFQDDAAAYALLIGKVVRGNLSESFGKLPGDKSADVGQLMQAR